MSARRIRVSKDFILAVAALHAAYLMFWLGTTLVAYGTPDVGFFIGLWCWGIAGAIVVCVAYAALANAISWARRALR
jgi:hypothetical protein